MRRYIYYVQFGFLFLAVIIFSGCPGLLSDPLSLSVPEISGVNVGYFNSEISFTLSGTDGAILQYSLDGGENWTDYSGEVTISDEGSYTITAREKDEDGNVSGQTSSISIVIDKTKPGLPTLAGLAAGYFNSELSFLLSGEEGAVLEYSLDGGTGWQTYSGEVSISDEGTYSLVFRQTDQAGNVSALSSALEFTIDKSLLDAPTLAGLSAGFFNNDLSFTLTGEEGATLEYSLDGGKTWKTYSGEVSLTTDDVYSITVRQTDSAGNVSAQSGAISVTLDTIAPDMPTFSGLNAGLFNDDQSVMLRGEIGADLEYSTDGGTTWNEYSAEFSLSSEGTYSLVARQTDQAGNTSDVTSSVFVSIDKTQPTVSLTSGSSLSTSASLVFLFSETMEIATIAITGDLISGLNLSSNWSKTNKENDTLTISPETSAVWNIINGDDIGVKGSDPAGNSTGDQSFIPDFASSSVVDSEGLFVNGSFSGTSDGTSSAPYTSIASALDAATAGTACSIYVAEGTYTLTEPIILKDKVSLYGGYDASDWTRDINGNETILQDGGTKSVIENSYGIDAYVIYGGCGISNTTVIDGFSIIGYSNDSSVGGALCFWVESGGSPTISNNIITAGDNVDSSIAIYFFSQTNSYNPIISGNTIYAGSGASEMSVGIWLHATLTTNSTPVITNNSITGGSNSQCVAAVYNCMSNMTVQGNNIYANGSSSRVSYGVVDLPTTVSYISENYVYGGTGVESSVGIQISKGSSIVSNNIISGGDGGYSGTSEEFIPGSIGILSIGSYAKVYNNTTDGGSAGTSYCIYVKNYSFGNEYSGGAVDIRNNILYSTADSENTSYGIYENSEDSSPITVANCCFNNLDILYHDYDSETNFTSLTDGILLELNDTFNSGLVIANPEFESDTDFHLTDDTPSSVASGGQNLYSTGITTDKDGDARSTSGSWSMGAYEHD